MTTNSRITPISLLCLVLVVLLFSGCSLRVRVGSRVQPDVVETALRVGESTSADVLRVLGEPLGKGRAMLPIDPQPRALWTYYYEEGDLDDSRRMFLFVYFLKDRYDGYMWFSSLPDVRDKPARLGG